MCLSKMTLSTLADAEGTQKVIERKEKVSDDELALGMSGRLPLEMTFDRDPGQQNTLAKLSIHVYFSTNALRISALASFAASFNSSLLEGSNYSSIL
jgi:hypothetical protein